MMQASMRALDYLKLVYFSAYLIATWAFTLLYGLNTIKRANTHYFLRIRFPSIVLGELVLFAGTSTIICLNELLWADKNPFPCFLTNLGSIGPPLVTTAIILTRSLQLFVVFDPAFRRAYHLYLPFIKVAIAWGTVWMLVLLMVLMQLQPMPFCHTPRYVGMMCLRAPVHGLHLIAPPVPSAAFAPAGGAPTARRTTWCSCSPSPS